MKQLESSFGVEVLFGDRRKVPGTLKTAALRALNIEECRLSVEIDSDPAKRDETLLQGAGDSLGRALQARWAQDTKWSRQQRRRADTATASTRPHSAPLISLQLQARGKRYLR